MEATRFTGEDTGEFPQVTEAPTAAPQEDYLDALDRRRREQMERLSAGESLIREETLVNIGGVIMSATEYEQSRGKGVGPYDGSGRRA